MVTVFDMRDRSKAPLQVGLGLGWLVGMTGSVQPVAPATLGQGGVASACVGAHARELAIATAAKLVS